MNDHERLLWVLVQEFESNVRSCLDQVKDPVEWVNSQDEAASLISRFRGTLIASLVGEVEELTGKSFSSLFDQLSKSPTPKNSKYWFSSMPSNSSSRGRAEVMWAIRVAYTHGNGHADQISDVGVRDFLVPNNAARHFQGVKVVNDRIELGHEVSHPAMKTVLELCDKFGPP